MNELGVCQGGMMVHYIILICDAAIPSILIPRKLKCDPDGNHETSSLDPSSSSTSSWTSSWTLSWTSS